MKTICNKIILEFVLFFLLLSGLSLPQNNLVSNQINNPPGFPIIKNYLPKEYKAHNQNWAIVKDKRYERIKKRTYDTVAYLEFEHKNRLYELTTLCPNLQLGSTSIIRIDPSNVGNCKLKNNDGSFYHVLSIKCIKVDISDSVKNDSLYRQILRDIN